MTAVERRLRWEHMLNARDLGGLPTRRGWTRFRALVRSDDLRRLTAEGQAAMLAYGVTTIVDLRSPRELELAPSRLRDHPGYRSLAYMDSDSVGAPSRFETAAENYLDWLRRHASGVAAILHGIADAPPGGILVHCHAGKDRTGVVVALLLSIAGVDREAIAEDYALSVGWNENVQDQEEIMVAPDAEERLRDRRIYYPRPENMLQMLAEVDRRHGGVDPYLDGIGVGSGVRARLRQRLA
ncbi:MAG TPA: tyrosine-protein phosphatase [Candidatus Dormibacteraeota bacterium]|nr:tyrosine-protein phosphatase [Candidatus Dormibacteraeota bacterium]